LNNRVVIFLAYTLEVCKGAHRYKSIWLSKDNHDSWGMCTTSIECKTVITAMLMVMRGMDPHMISGNLGWVLVKSCLGCVEVGFISVSHRFYHCFLRIKPKSSLPCY
jgi:hypothetical protein